jgi:hypothetical protein
LITNSAYLATFDVVKDFRSLVIKKSRWLQWPVVL